jgi:hypothetical protein
MIPPRTSPVWERLATGQISHKFSLFAANMAVSMATRTTKADPSRKAQAVDEMYKFFEKYANATAAELNSLH